MFFIPQPHILKTKILFSAFFLALLTTSCSEIERAARKPISEEEACTRLKGLIADHPNNFKKYQKSLRRVRNLNTWSAEKVFPMAENCQVWEWSTGLHSYICNWQARDGMASAKADYQDGNRIIQSCLGPEWEPQTNTTQSGGERTVYRKEGSKTLVGIRYFKESRSIIGSWHTVVTIGDDSNLRAPLQ